LIVFRVGNREPEERSMTVNGRHRTRASLGLAALAGATAVAAGVIAFSGGGGEASAAESCQGLDAALQNNLNFIAGQQAAPDAQSSARIENRQAVVDLIQQRREAAGCTADVQPTTPAGNPPATENPAQPPATGNPARPPATDVVCDGSTVTLSGEDGAPAASSDQFPSGTRLKVTNLDNGKSITVEVTGVSGSCVLLNDAAFEQVREPGRFLIRRAVVERVG
jgi:hypothetical protein